MHLLTSQKALDKVDHYLLGHCLIKQNISPDLILTVLHYLRNQTARACWNDVKGDYKYVDKGVCQGGILSPFLFKLYIDDLLNRLSGTNVGCKLGLLRMNVLAYADDLILVADSLNHLECLYEVLDQGINDLKLTINKK